MQPTQRRQLEDRQPVALGTRAFDLLTVLVERAGQPVAKNELVTRTWAGLGGAENSLQVQVSTLRKLLGQGTEGAAMRDEQVFSQGFCDRA